LGVTALRVLDSGPHSGLGASVFFSLIIGFRSVEVSQAMTSYRYVFEEILVEIRYISLVLR
jgi:hypothetical protein